MHVSKCEPFHMVIRAPVQYWLRRLIIRSREIPKSPLGDCITIFVTAIVYGGKFKFAVATIWWVMVSLSVLIGWIWRHLLESDRLPFPTVSFLLPETLSRLSCDSSLILEPATMMKEAWYSKVCIQCHPCLIIGYLVLYFGLLSSMYPDLSVVMIILRRLTNLWRYFVGISWGFFHLSSGNLVTRENIFRNL